MGNRPGAMRRRQDERPSPPSVPEPRLGGNGMPVLRGRQLRASKGHCPVPGQLGRAEALQASAEVANLPLHGVRDAIFLQQRS